MLDFLHVFGQLSGQLPLGPIHIDEVFILAENHIFTICCFCFPYIVSVELLSSLAPVQLAGGIGARGWPTCSHVLARLLNVLLFLALS